MVAYVKTVSFHGINVKDVDVQTHMASGLPAFTIVGLPDKTVAESRERIRSALSAIGLALPSKRITVNLSPADLQKEGSHFDLPVIVGILAVMGIIPQENLDNYILMGELSLDGRISPVSGILPTSIHAKASGYGLVCPKEQANEAGWVPQIPILTPNDVIELVDHFLGKSPLPFFRPVPKKLVKKKYSVDLKEIKGQQHARRALEIAASGGHHLLMSGPPGAGKSLLASCLPSILPELSAQEILETSMVHSFAGILEEKGIVQQRPFRSPHHSASMVSIVGGGNKPKPGEISLAHNGVLFLDEMPEFQRAALESLRQPLEMNHITISRANYHVTYPARIQLVAAMNPCRCGYLDDPGRACSQAPKCAVNYQAKISGPLLDRIDLHLDVAAVLPQELFSMDEGESSANVMKRVQDARNLQKKRYRAFDIETNAQASNEIIEKTALLEGRAKQLLHNVAEKMRFSARSWYRTIRVARTLADLQQNKTINKSHVAEAVSYKQRYMR